jgi:rhodanese-related sulfurtransferase
MLVLIIASVFLGGCAYITGEAITTPSPTHTTAIVIKNVSPEEAHGLLMLSSKWVHVIDVRTPEEYAENHLMGAVNIDLNSEGFKKEINNLEKDAAYLVYCRSGTRSAAASAVMAELGFREIYNMTGGIIAWQAAGYPVVR